MKKKGGKDVANIRVRKTKKGYTHSPGQHREGVMKPEFYFFGFCQKAESQP